MGQPQRKLLALAIAAAFSAGHARAELPTGGQVVAGNATINNVGAHQQNITQMTDKAIINFQSFGIGSNDAVLINQLNAKSILLGRVVGNDPSNILGNLTANGQLFLVNPNGIYFGAGATLDVGGLVATTLNIRDDDFLSGRYLFRRESTSATRADVINDGVLRAREGGYVVLAGDYAANRGVVEAKLGTVMLGAAQQLTLDINGDNLVSFALNERNMTALAGVANSGQLLADGGRVVMTASTARTLANSAVNNSGVIQARGVEEKGGSVYLLADGGTITVDGSSRIDVSGDKGGGTVLIGGNFHGEGSEIHADRVVVASGATINADARVNGNGGKVAIWSDDATSYKGSISARGGAQGGNGGFVEVSGKNLLGFAGTVDTRAPKGTIGTLLLDPADITISTAADTDITAGPTFSDATNNGGVSNLSVTTLQNQLGLSDVTVSTGTATGGNAGTITVQNAISWATASNLTLQANNQIAINGAITATSGTLSLFPGSFQGATQSAAINVSRLVLSGDGDFNLTNAGNNIGTLSTNANIFKINGSLNLVNSGGLSLDTVWATGNTRLNVGGSLTQTTGALTTTGLEVVSSAGGVTLDNSNNSIATVAAATHGATSIRSGGGLTVGSVGGTSGVNSNGNDVTLQSGGTLTASQSITATGARVTLNAAGGVSQTGGAIVANAMQLLGSSTFTVNQGGNNVATLAANVAGSVNYRDSDGLDIGSVNGTNGINTNGNTATIRTGGALTQTQSIVTNGLEVISGSTATLTNGGNSFGVLAADVNGAFNLNNAYTGTTYVQTVGGTTGINTHNSNFTLTDAGTLYLGANGASGTVNVGSGTADLTVDSLFQGANAPLIADKLAARATHFFGLRGNYNNSINTLAAVITNGGTNDYFDLGNNKSIAVGTVNSLSGITTNGRDALVQANGNITLNSPINLGSGKLGLFAAYNGGYYALDFNGQFVNAFGLGIQANTTSGFSTNARLLAVDIHTGFNFHTGGDLTIGTVWGLAGLKASGDVYIKTGTFAGFDPLASPTTYYNSGTGKSTAGLMIDETINAAGHKIYLESDSGIFQWANDIGPPPGPRNNAAIIADSLMISGTGNFDMSLPANKINHFAADVTGSVAFLSSSPFTVDQQTFNNFSVNKTITGVQTHAQLVSGSVAGGDALYTQHNITLAASDDPNGSRAALTINKSIIADPLGQSTINLTVGASDNHKDALVATNAGDSSVMVQGTLLILGSAKDKGAFELRTNVTQLSAAGGKYMLIDNSAQTGQLTVLGIGTSQGGGAPTPVGDFYLTTGGKLLLLGGKSEGNYLQLRADDLTMFGTMDLKDGARVLLQPYTHTGNNLTNTIGIHNAYDVIYGANWAQTNYTRSTLLQFGQTATIYVGSTPSVMNQDASVPSAVKNLVATNEIHIASDGDTGMKMGYRSLSAETTNKIVAYQIGDVYNLRLAAPTVTVGGFNATGERVDLIANTLNLPNAKGNYLTPNNATFLLSPWTQNKSIWIGWIEPAYASEVNYSFDLLDKLDKGSGTTIIISGTTDRVYSGSYLRLAHAELAAPQTTHYHALSSKLILSTTGTVDTSNGAFGYLGSGFGQRTLQNWNQAPFTYPLAIRVESGSSLGGGYVSAQSGGTYSNPATLFGYGAAGGVFLGCADLNTCKGTNPSIPTTPGINGTVVNQGGGGGGTSSCTGNACNNNNNNNTNPQPPASPSPDPTNGVNNNAANTPNNTGNGSNNGGNNGNNTGNIGGTGNTGNNDPGDPANANSNSGMNNGGPSNNSGNTSSGSGNGGNNSNSSSNGGNNGSGSGNDGTGGNNSSNSGSNGGNDSGSSGNGNNSSGSGNNGGGNSSGGSGNGGNGGGNDGSGSGGSGNGNDGSGSGSGSGNGGAGGGNSSDGSGSGSGGSGNSGGGDGNGSGSGSGGSGNGGSGDSGDGNGNGSGSGGGSSGSGNSGDGSGSGSSGSGGSGSGDSGDGNGNGNGSGGGSSGSGDSGDGNGSGSGSGGGNGGAGDSGDGSGSGSKSSGSGGGNDSDSGSGNGSGKGGNSGADSGDGGNGTAGSKGSGDSGADDSDSAGGKSGKSGNGGGTAGDGSSGDGSGDGTSGGKGKGGNSGAGSGDDAAGNKGGDGSGADDSDGANGKSGKSGNGGGKTGDKDGGDGSGDGSGGGKGKGGNSGAGDSDDGGSGGGADEGDGSSGASGADKSGEGGSDGGGSGGGVSTSEERLCIDGSNANRGQDLPEQGGALAARPLLEIRAGGVNMESECSRNSQVAKTVGGKTK